jgi:hypothetical protein
MHLIKCKYSSEVFIDLFNKYFGAFIWSVCISYNTQPSATQRFEQVLTARRKRKYIPTYSKILRENARHGQDSLRPESRVEEDFLSISDTGSLGSPMGSRFIGIFCPFGSLVLENRERKQMGDTNFFFHLFRHIQGY